jgi:signal transduction histidine kinase
VRSNAQHLDHLVSNLLELSHLGRQPLREALIRPEELLRDAWEQLKPDWETRAQQGQIELQFGRLHACRADRTLLRQVFVNLLHNALKFTRRTSHAVIEVGSEAHGDSAVYYVKDNGVGFDMAYADKLFGLFQRLHRGDDYEGTGVGLAIVHRIVTRHNGRLWARAEVGRGATFYFTVHERADKHAEVGR